MTRAARLLAKPLLLATILAAGLAGPGPATAETEPPSAPPPPAAAAARPAPLSPYALLRTLQALQERIAEGDLAAHEAQRGLIGAITGRFAEADPAVWADPRNARAAIAFVLAGGPPQSLSAILAATAGRADAFGADRTMAQGALAFLQGREDEAQAALSPIDAMRVGGPLGAQLAMAQSALAVRESAAEAMRLLAVARLLAPGTLIEEAALRREIFVAGQSGDVERLEFLATQYMRRFRHSIYAGNFRQRFAVLLTALDFDGDLDRFARLETLLERFDAESRRDIYLFFARHSLIHGRTTVARRAATLAYDLSAGGSDEEERAAFYAAASQVATERYALAADALADLDPARLSPPDVLLLEAVLDLAIRIGAPLPLATPDEAVAEAVVAEEEVVAEEAAAEEEADPQAEIAADVAPDEAAPAPDTPLAFEPPAPTPVMRRAEAALASIDLLLTEHAR
ncbi:chemotaxis protein MotC [Salinarimonas sp.]|uniref:chemotaxis protein MotC n=1 Tax=Salinarimonas sp. TaxID=2766526 RepID=UPI0032D99EF1